MHTECKVLTSNSAISIAGYFGSFGCFRYLCRWSWFFGTDCPARLSVLIQSELGFCLVCGHLRWSGSGGQFGLVTLLACSSGACRMGKKVGEHNHVARPTMLSNLDVSEYAEQVGVYL